MSGKEVQLGNEIDSVSYSLGVNIAQNIKSQGMDELNIEAMANAFSDVFEDDSLKIDEMTCSMLINTYFQNLQSSNAEESMQEGLAFLEENKSRQNVVTTESGLQYEVLEEGSGPKPGENDTVSVHYHGTTIDGTVFDSSVDRGEPVSFPVNGVIQGWQEALQLMPAGSKWKIFVPSELAYGERGAGRDIGPNETLVFEVELISIN
ncbi:MAG: FKBP-type peptidyl-prolyl cis-trans isomerase [Cyclobacteriaceae bacterium]|nr:FKBP-type peptidyl-prolyl cis-trans isomerase [Cyclobacteriaceae bacterium]